jgi:hypothetical protein
MPLLEKGSMDKVRTGDEPLPNIKGAKLKLIAPHDDEAKKREVYKSPDGDFEITRFNCQIQEGDYRGRFVQYSAFTAVSQSAYLSWNMKDKDGNPLSQGDKLRAWEEKQYLSDLKRLGIAIGVDFEEQDIVDAYGKEFQGNVIQRIGKDGEPRNEVKYPRKLKS